MVAVYESASRPLLVWAKSFLPSLSDDRNSHAELLLYGVESVSLRRFHSMLIHLQRILLLLEIVRQGGNSARTNGQRVVPVLLQLCRL